MCIMYESEVAGTSANLSLISLSWKYVINLSFSLVRIRNELNSSVPLTLSSNCSISNDNESNTWSPNNGAVSMDIDADDELSTLV